MTTATTPRIYKTNKAILVQGFRGGSPCPYPDFTLPAGLRCRAISEGGTAGKFFLTELPRDIFPPNSFIRHDADHYGVVLEAADVDDLTPMKPDWPSNKPMTHEAIETFRAGLSAPYATAQRHEKLLTLYVHYDGTFSVVYDRETTFGPTTDLEAAVGAFKLCYGASPEL
jgi:hypothetical protein